MAAWLALLACTESPAPAPRAVALPGLGLEAVQRDPVQATLTDPLPGPSGQVFPLRLTLQEGFQVPGVLFLPQGPGPHPAVLMAHGHFGEGKSAGEVQGPAHSFAANGYVVLALDTPGVEEGDQPGRALHFAEGGANRLHLARAGSSAMAVQLAGLQAGLDYLEQRPDVDGTRIAVSGASGGAVQAFYLSLVDPRPVAVVMASPVPMPHPSTHGGCLCDVVDVETPGAALLSALPDPSLWMVEDGRPAPAGLPESAVWHPVPGEHGYTAEMIERALDFLAPLLGGGTRLLSPLPHMPSTSLQGPVPSGNLRQLVPAPSGPPAAHSVPLTLSCQPGKGKRIAVLGVSEPQLPDGLRACPVTFSEEGPLEVEILLARAGGSASLGAALRASGAKGVLAQGAYGPAALASGLPAAVIALPTTSEGLPWYAEGDWSVENCVGCVDDVAAGGGWLHQALWPSEEPPLPL